MDKYQVIGLLGEGSFGRVYKAKQLSNNSLVALKVICKRGRCSKELKGLRRECEIQRHLHHPNIIQMLDSFETDNEIVVITEFAHKELNALLGKKGVVPEETVQKIVWDLVSALYYLHSHRVLHRDLKPQNILLDTKNRAKLCDFGFARNMSIGTHVLTSIKGTPLYMAPELVEEQPYDHNADLWSLGCIIYELLEGAPPFRTTSILHLIKLIRHEQIQWPTMVSEHCISFLKGLLQKNPQKRMTWPEILNHPFVKGHIIISQDTPEMALTRPLSVNTLELKEQQKRDHVNKRTANQNPLRNRKITGAESKEMQVAKELKQLSLEEDVEMTDKDLETPQEAKLDKTKNQDLQNNNQIQGDTSVKDNLQFRKNSCAMSVDQQSFEGISDMVNTVEPKEASQASCKAEEFKTMDEDYEGKKIDFIEHSYKIENDEWLAFLKKSIGELKHGDLTTFTQSSMLDIMMSPLLNSTASPEVVCLVVKLFCLPFVMEQFERNSLTLLKSLYLNINLVPNLLYAMHLLLRPKTENCQKQIASQQETGTVRNLFDLSSEDFDCLEYICLAVNHFVHWNEQYVEQFCDAVATINGYSMMKLLLLCTKRKLRIVIDLMATLTQVLRMMPKRHIIIDRILLSDPMPNMKSFNIVELLRHVNPLLRERTCYFLLRLGSVSPDCAEHIWSEVVRDTLEALMYDSIDTVRIAAERAHESLKDKPFYSKLNQK